MRRFATHLFLFFGLLLGLKGLALLSFRHYRHKPMSSQFHKADQFDSLGRACNAVFIGSSRTFMSVIPSRFDSLTGHPLRSYNYGVANFFAPHSLQLTEELMCRRDLSLQYVFLELSLPTLTPSEEPFFSNPLLEIGYYLRAGRSYSQQAGTGVNAWINTYLITAFSPRSIIDKGPALTKLYCKNPGMAVSGGYDFAPSPDGYLRDKRMRSVNFAAVVRSLPTTRRLARQAFGSHQTPAPDAHYWADVTRLLQLAEDRHIRLLFYLPNRLTADEARLLPAIFNQLPAANRLEVYPDQRFDSLFSAASSFDRAHLNHYGAQQYTVLLAEAFGRASQAQLTVAKK